MAVTRKLVKGKKYKKNFTSRKRKFRKTKTNNKKMKNKTSKIKVGGLSGKKGKTGKFAALTKNKISGHGPNIGRVTVPFNTSHLGTAARRNRNDALPPVPNSQRTNKNKTEIENDIKTAQRLNNINNLDAELERLKSQGEGKSPEAELIKKRVNSAKNDQVKTSIRQAFSLGNNISSINKIHRQLSREDIDKLYNKSPDKVKKAVEYKAVKRRENIIENPKHVKNPLYATANTNSVSLPPPRPNTKKPYNEREREVARKLKHIREYKKTLRSPKFQKIEKIGQVKKNKVVKVMSELLNSTKKDVVKIKIGQAFKNVDLSENIINKITEELSRKDIDNLYEKSPGENFRRKIRLGVKGELFKLLVKGKRERAAAANQAAAEKAEVEQEAKEKAATKIQAAYRGMKVRKEAKLEAKKAAAEQAAAEEARAEKPSAENAEVEQEAKKMSAENFYSKTTALIPPIDNQMYAVVRNNTNNQITENTGDTVKAEKAAAEKAAAEAEGRPVYDLASSRGPLYNSDISDKRNRNNSSFPELVFPTINNYAKLGSDLYSNLEPGLYSNLEPVTKKRSSNRYVKDLTNTTREPIYGFIRKFKGPTANAKAKKTQHVKNKIISNESKITKPKKGRIEQLIKNLKEAALKERRKEKFSKSEEYGRTGVTNNSSTQKNKKKPFKTLSNALNAFHISEV
tara:strand:+ start:1515 stop:3569 length:2055 start_codon:yes stop_codon:yes gene_type:complete